MNSDELNKIMMEKSKVDVAVLLLFFTRTAHTVQTFKQVCKAKPSRLYLYQDGPRKGRIDDVVNIKECRETIESMITWDCEVHKLYQEKNYGCDPSEYIAQKWMFETEEKGIVIEDDDVMSVSFFRFCKELLDKYENDQRINIICGMNHLGTYDAGGADYFFARRGGAIWGWASWRRVINQWDSQYSFLKDKYANKCLQKQMGKQKYSNFISLCKKHLSTGREHYESILGSCSFLNDRLNIIPAKNMTCNIGIGMETVHSVSDITLLPRSVRKVLFMKTYEYEGEIKHPNYVIEDKVFEELLEKISYGSFITKALKLRKIEGAVYRLLPFLGKIGSKDTLERIKQFKLFN
jgi:hypothetical protein